MNLVFLQRQRFLLRCAKDLFVIQKFISTDRTLIVNTRSGRFPLRKVPDEIINQITSAFLGDISRISPSDYELYTSSKFKKRLLDYSFVNAEILKDGAEKALDIAERQKRFLDEDKVMLRHYLLVFPYLEIYREQLSRKPVPKIKDTHLKAPKKILDSRLFQ